LPSPDLATYFKNNALIYDRFKISVPAEAGCGLQTTNDAGGGPVLSLASAKPGPVFLPEGELYFGAVTLAGPDRAGAGAQHVLKGLRLVYRTVLPIAGVAAILCFIWRLAMLCRGQRADGLLILATGLWILLLSRCFILLLVDISAFPAISQLYMLPGFTVSCMAIAISAALPFRARFGAQDSA
jgi:hypothetical protein